jgi:hypothetical protein
VPLAGRLLWDYVWGSIKDPLKRCICRTCCCCCPKCCGGRGGCRGEGDDGPLLAANNDHLQGRSQDYDRGGGYTMWMVDNNGSSWAAAVAANDQSPCGATTTAAARLLLWHWLQPALYYAVFLSYWAELDDWQRGFGSAVAAREALYALTVLAALCGNPAFLLVDVGASVRDTDAEHGEGGYAFLAMYVLAPDKLAAAAAFSEGGCGLAPGAAPPFRSVLGLRLAAIPHGARTRISRSSLLFSGQNDRGRPGLGTTAAHMGLFFRS